MPDRTLTYPPEMAGFRPHGTGNANIQLPDGTIYHAALGGIGDDKATFKVYVWSEKPDGTLKPCPVADPPNNAPSFYVKNGKLILSGVLETAPNTRFVVEREIADYADLALARASAALKLARATRAGIIGLGEELPEV